MQTRDFYRALDMEPSKAEVFYLERLPLYEHTKPYFLSLPGDALPQLPQSNQCHEAHTVEVCDARGHEYEFSLDVNGFEFTLHPLDPKFTYANLKSDPNLRDEYQSEVADFLKLKLAAKDVIIFDESVCEATLGC